MENACGRAPTTHFREEPCMPTCLRINTFDGQLKKQPAQTVFDEQNIIWLVLQIPFSWKMWQSDKLIVACTEKKFGGFIGNV
jgi:hypothetical protein